MRYKTGAFGVCRGEKGVIIRVLRTAGIGRTDELLGCRQVAKAPGFDPGIRRFESCHPSHIRTVPALT